MLITGQRSRGKNIYILCQFYMLRVRPYLVNIIYRVNAMDKSIFNRVAHLLLINPVYKFFLSQHLFMCRCDTQVSVASMSLTKLTSH